MPIYEFKCYNCGKNFEKLIFKREEEKEINCPYCGSKKIEKLLTSFSSVKSKSNVFSCGSGRFS